MLRFTPLLAILPLLIACQQAPKGKGAGEILTTPDSTTAFRVKTVASGLEVPWDVVFAPGGRIFITERPGRVRVIRNGVLQPTPYLTLTDVESRGESGLMGMTLHPAFSTNGLVYLAYAYTSGGELNVRVVRYRDSNNAAVDRKVIIEGIPAANFHAGCRLRFGPDQKLYITTGEATEKEIAQNLGSLGGKVLRLGDDGSIPRDNPFVGRSGARQEIWSYGHRNPQGIDFQPGTGALFLTEHGPSGNDAPGGGDEVNIVERGGNYGWPVVHHEQSQTGMISPILLYTPAVAPASGVFYTGDLFPQLKGNFFFGCLKGESIVRVVLDGGRVVKQETLFKDEYGRIRAMAVGPDGAIYFTTSNRDGRGAPAPSDDRLMKLLPAR